MRRKSRLLLQLLLPLGALLAVIAGMGFHVGRSLPADSAPPSFHSVRVNHPEEYSRLVDSRCPYVSKLARELGTPEAAYRFVRDRIRHSPSAAAAPPGEIIHSREASCLGKATLLASLYRCMGFRPEEVRVVTGTVALGENEATHAWVDLEYRGRCLQQDPSTFLGVFGFSDFPGTAFSDFFVTEEHFVFNDTGLALVSQLNRMPGFPESADITP